MISRVHSKLGTAGLVVAIVALVVALTGVAFAATGLNSKQKKEVKKIAKQFAGEDGAPGATGAQGAKGDKGDKGDTGAEGKQGAPGKDGKNGLPGEDGACSGANPECILPSGATETGTWAAGPAGLPTIVALPFNIPLAEAPDSMHYVNAGGEEQFGTFPLEFRDPVNCLGTAEEPSAPSGVVCVYASGESFEPPTARTPDINGNSKLFTSGATLFFTGEEAFAFGTYAVTAE